MTSINIVNNEKENRFEYIVEGELAELQYKIRNNNMYFMHTGVPKSMKGQGIGEAIVKQGLEYAVAQNLNIVVYCPFVKTYLERHPEYTERISEIVYKV